MNNVIGWRSGIPNTDFKCSVCGSSATYIDKTRWGLRAHWRYDVSGKPICGRCYARALWKKRVPAGIRCDLCKTSDPTKTKYGTPKWVRNWCRKGGFLCRRCYIIQRDTGITFPENRKKNISVGIRRALDSGATMGPKVHTMDEGVFDETTEESAYWIGYLMADGNVHIGKTGNPRVSLTLAAEDRDHLVKFRRFLNCSNEIQMKISKVRGKVWNQYTLRFSSKQIANALKGFGVTARKSLSATVIGLENDRHFWRGVIDGDGYLKNRDGRDGDRITVVGSYYLMRQLEDFVKNNAPDSDVIIEQDGRFCRLHVYGYTARMLAELLYGDSQVALDRKLAKARQMFSCISDVFGNG